MAGKALSELDSAIFRDGSVLYGQPYLLLHCTCLQPQNRDIFMTGGGNGGFNIYKYHYPLNRVTKHGEDGLPIGKMGDIELLNSRVISTQPVTSFDWSPDKAGLCCMSCLDQTVR